MTKQPGRIRDRRWVGALLWVLAVVLMLATAVYQRRTGPTHPLRGEAMVDGTAVAYRLIRSANTGADARVAIPDPGGVEGELRWRRYPTDDPYTGVPLRLEGDDLVAALPSQPPAGKLEYHLVLRGGSGEEAIPPDRSAVIRFKGAVPAAALIPHILAMFFGVLWGLRTLLEALLGRRGLAWMTYATLGLIGVGGMFLGPVVQKYAFGAFWTGVPFGWDLTDNKTLVMFVCWLCAAAALRWRRTAPTVVRWAVGGAAAVMVIVYLIPHSMYGSELDYEQLDSGVDPTEAIGQG